MKMKNIQKLYDCLKQNNFKTSEYYNFIIYEPKKKRDISSLPFYPDRIIHHAIINILEPILTKSFISTTYSCVRKRGILKCLKDLNKALKCKKRN